MSSDTHIFRTIAGQTETKPLSPTVIHIGRDDALPLRLILYKIIFRRHWLEPPGCFSNVDGSLVTERGITAPLSRIKVAENLSRMSVPEDEHPGIIEKIFQVVEVAVPGLPVTVVILELIVTAGLFGFVTRVDGDMVVIDRIIQEYIDKKSIDCIENCGQQMPNFIRTQLSSPPPVEGLENVRVDRLEDRLRQSRCPICNNKLDNQGIMIARMPCSHLFHEHCIVERLKMSSPCPVCQFLMLSELPCRCEPLTKLTTGIICAGGIVTAAVLIRWLLKRV